MLNVTRDVADTVKAQLARILQIGLFYVYILSNSNERNFFCIVLARISRVNLLLCFFFF